jgi:hypothetical protein
MNKQTGINMPLLFGVALWLYDWLAKHVTEGFFCDVFRVRPAIYTAKQLLKT